MKKKAWKKEAYGLLPIQARIPCTLPANAPLRSLDSSRRHQHRMILERYEGHLGWYIVDGWFVPYEWSEFDSMWYRVRVDVLSLPRTLRVGQKSIPVTFSSEHTASSPRHPGELET